jgi:hypothetical protein
MRKRQEDPRPSELGTLLRQGDPAADGSELGPAEVERMRRRVVRAAAEDRVAGLPGLPILRLAGYAAAALAVVLAGWAVLENLPTEAPVRPPEVRPETSVPVVTPPPVEAASGTPSPQPAAAEGSPVENVLPSPVAGGEPAPVVKVATAGGEEPPAPERPAALHAEPRASRQMQFVTPNGTRVIWTLNPNLDLGALAPGKGEVS